ncbi:MAG: (2Fe-2S)-binding protein [Desulfohalobiaceae bacterium]|nr:(2Fe-2S)-binding protein [Desulfohalobiaceae bacterium]
MSDLRIPTHPRKEKITVYVNGREVLAYAGESLHAALLAAGFFVLRRAGSEPRGFFCGMGVCYDCLVTVDGRPGQRACMTRVEDRMEVELDVD